MKETKEFLEALQGIEITWIATRRDPKIFEAVFEGEHCQIRLNDFPDEPLYTVFFRDEEIDLEEGPKNWHLQD